VKTNLNAGRILLGSVLAALSAAAAWPDAPAVELTQANAALQTGEADKALALLQPLTQADSGQIGARNQAEAHNLECRVRYILEQWDRAASECEKAVNLDRENAEYHMWLGRALGEKAGRASFLSAYSLGKRVRAEFEESVRLNPRSAESLQDLGEFYYSAPSVVGGGSDKAEKVATQLDRIEPARAHELRGHIAEEHKDFGTAEREFKQAVAVAAHPAFQWGALASFYRRRARWMDMESAVQSCMTAAEHDKHAAVALYDAASVLIRTNRNPLLAAKMMESYLAGSLKTEEAPAFVAHVRLGRLKEQMGDTEGAKRERALALALAHDYKPAQEMKH
jgi:tetratricopeptide (TPR) repeat protein